MASSLHSLLSSMSDAQVNKYLLESHKYTPEAIATAVNELKKRGRIFTELELETIRDTIKQKEIAAKEEDLTFEDRLKQKIVDDPNAPLYYSHRAILGFSSFFTVFAGAVLLASNVKGNNKARWVIIGFSVIYTGLAIYLSKSKARRHYLLLLTAGELG